MKIATVTIDKQQAELLLRDRVDGAETSGTSGSSRTLVAEFKHGGGVPLVLAGCPDSRLPRISDGEEGVLEVLHFVMNDHGDHWRIDWDLNLLKNPKYYGSIGGMSAYKEDPLNRKERAKTRASDAARARHWKPMPQLVAEGPEGRRLSVSAEQSPDRKWTVHWEFSSGDKEVKRDYPFKKREDVDNFYSLAADFAQDRWGMPERWADEVISSWRNSQTGSGRKRRGGTNHD